MNYRHVCIVAESSMHVYNEIKLGLIKSGSFGLWGKPYKTYTCFFIFSLRAKICVLQCIVEVDICQ